MVVLIILFFLRSLPRKEPNKICFDSIRQSSSSRSLFRPRVTDLSAQLAISFVLSHNCFLSFYNLGLEDNFYTKFM